MSVKRVGVTQRIQFVESYREYRDELDHRILNWVLASGHAPVGIPNILISRGCKVLDDWLQHMGIEALLLSGGGDVGEECPRDLTEQHLLEWASENKTPALGICRGMQAMACKAGAEIHAAQGHAGTRHNLLCDGRAFDADKVNSYHNFALRNCPDDYVVIASAEDGCIEAIQHTELPWEAWMWHPEREPVFRPTEINRFNDLISNAS